MSKRLFRFEYGLLIAALVPLLAILPTLYGGAVQGADTAVHIHRIHAMTEMLQSGNLWPRWVPYFHLGYGYPIFNFYAPGASYLGALLEILGLQAALAYSLINALAWVIGSVGMYKLGRQFLPVPAAILSATLWVYAPSRLFEIWWQGSLSQSLAAALIPWLFYGIISTGRTPRYGSILVIALSLTGIILTHQPIMFITALFAGPLALFVPLWEVRQQKTPLIRPLTFVLGGCVLGVALAAIFLLPVIFELKYVNAEQGTTDNVAYLISNFLKLDEVFVFPKLIDLTDMRLVMPRTLGLIGGVLSLFGLAALLRQKRYILSIALSLGLLFSIFMLLEASVDVWLTIPYFRQLRFAERFLRVGVVIIGLLGGASLLLLPRRWQMAGLLIGMGFVIAQALPILNPHETRLPLQDLTAVDEINFELAERAWGTTSYEEFNPIWGENISFDPPPEPALYNTMPLRIPVKELDILRQYPDLQTEQLTASTTRVTVDSERPVRLRQYYFPGWSATLDGQPVEAYPDEEWGLLTINIPEGEHIVEIAYRGTPVQHIGTLITLLALGLTALLFYHDRATQDKPQQFTNDLQRRSAYGLCGLLIGGTVIYGIFALPINTALKQQSPADRPLYMQTASEHTFGDAIQLLGYDLPQSAVTPGQQLDIILYWRALQPLDREYAPRVQLVSLNRSAAWAVSETLAPGGVKTTQYSTEHFISDPHQLRIFADAPPYMGQIAIQLINLTTSEPLILEDGTDTVYLEPLIRIMGNSPTVSQSLDYILDNKIELRCASIAEQEGQFAIDLYWYVRETPTQNLVALVHGLDSNGALIAQNDAVPLAGNYPAALWQPGQTLVDRHTLPAEHAITTVGIGLYTAIDIQRLPVLQSGQPVADNLIHLPLKQQSCLP